MDVKLFAILKQFINNCAVVDLINLKYDLCLIPFCIGQIKMQTRV